jgi:hypothetical protein
MRLRLFTAVVWLFACVIADAAALKDDGSLDSVAKAVIAASGTDPCPLGLTAHVVQKKEGYFLRFTLKNISGRSLTFYRKDLPWGNVDSIRIAAVTSDGHLVLAGYPIEDDFGVDQVAVAPGQTLEGDYDLSHRWSDKAMPPNGFPRSTTVVLIWAYTVRPIDIPSKHWPVCTGVTALKVPG